jgi:hypothetical protein
VFVSQSTSGAARNRPKPIHRARFLTIASTVGGRGLDLASC